MSRQRTRRPSRGRHDRRARRITRRNRLGWLLLAGVLLVCAGIGGAVVYERTKHVPVASDTFCPTDRPPAKIVALLVDTSDPLTPVQSARLRQEIKNMRQQIPRYGALEIYDVGSTDTQVREPIFRACNPGAPDEIEAWRESPKLARRRWKSGFVEPLNRLGRKLGRTDGAARSPIMESIQSLAVTAFAGADRGEVPKQLIVVSDMLQHTDRLSHYRGDVDFKRFSQRSAYGNLTAELMGVRVRLLYLRRPETAEYQGRDHIQFWQQYFAAQGATLTNVVALSG